MVQGRWQGGASERGADDLEQLLQHGFRYALALTHDRTRAEDVLQDAWVAVLRAGGPHRRGYLFAAIRSRFIDQYRREQLVVIEPIADPDLAGAQSAADMLGDADAFRADLDTLARALGTLRAPEREALYLAAVEGYTAAEIAENTHQPRGTVLSLIHRARKKVRAFFDSVDEEAAP